MIFKFCDRLIPIFIVGLLLPSIAAAQAIATAPTDDIDHAGIIRSWNSESLGRGEKLYNGICITCHGNLTQPGSLPTSRPFWKEPFKNGNDPLSLYKTLTTGFGQMPAWTFLTPEQRYDAIHYIRETFVKPHNPAAYFTITPTYLDNLPKGNGRGVKTAEMIEFEKGPKYLQMNFGPALFWTLQVAPDNIAYKGIAIRLDDGPGGVSRGHLWMLYDHDTMRVATAWSGSQFVDWKGIAFDGSHQTHTSIVGDKAFVNPVGPGWANPMDGSFSDPRFKGRDNKPYGPLPREWTHFKGVHFSDNHVVVAYTVGDAGILELPGYERSGAAIAFSRALNIGKSSRDLWLRVAPEDVPVALVGKPSASLEKTNGFNVLHIPKEATPLNLKLLIAQPTPGVDAATLFAFALVSQPAPDLSLFTHGGAPRWNPPLATQGKLGSEDGPFAVDELTPPPDASNPWHTWLRFGGFDFFKDGRRAAICTWNGDVWIVDGVEGNLAQLTWKRIASGLFQPLGLKIVDETIYVTCRDQIARLHDLNGDGEIDFVENFNNDHQVTEHFHEFAMGLQTDSDGNFYYAKSARHALPALVPHHGTLLKVTRDGLRTEIVANGFRAANGVCVNDDGTFFVTDQEGHWTPKNRINWIHPGGFYGNMFGFHDRTSSADADMEQPLVWITNDMDRSPGELVWVRSEKWGPLNGTLLNLSYGTGKIFVVPYEKMGSQLQGGVVQLPIPDSPTGTMRGRFHPGNGDLYTCGLFAWAGNRTADGGFHRIRPTGKPTYLPIGLHAHSNGIEVQFTDPVDATAAIDAGNYSVKVWSLERSANYGSRHVDEHSLKVTSATVGSDKKTIFLTVPDLKPTWCMEIKASIRGLDGTSINRTIHNTIHELGAPLVSGNQ
jgi:mono/diheme cytochrome c family protein